ncbi:hypothetical protein [Streptomyces sp. HPF1205]|uniref:hypothetical protein n=1 Tax=Streptomyces sp. HPF1205 TaxID=2873262 RepID=UPI001CEDEECC|nr:hypothetical protein [Streptomyces sp. HPF1205]
MTNHHPQPPATGLRLRARVTPLAFLRARAHRHSERPRRQQDEQAPPTAAPDAGRRAQ